MPIAIATTDAAHIANVVTEQRNYEVQPVVRRDTSLADMLATQDLLAKQRHHDRVLDVVVSYEFYDSGITRLQQAVDALIHPLQLVDKCVDDELRWIEHPTLPRNGLCLLHLRRTRQGRIAAMRHSRRGALGMPHSRAGEREMQRSKRGMPASTMIRRTGKALRRIAGQSRRAYSAAALPFVPRPNRSATPRP